jgi:hypothetical protein
MAQFGSGRSVISQNQSAVSDSNGNLIVSPDDSFGGSPLGIAARTQALYGIPNANFDILPADPYSPITTGNELPYWDVSINGLGTATMSYDDTTQAWAVRLDPTAGTASGETITMKARTYLLNDSNLTLRQKAFVNIAKVGTQATSEWNLVLSATYYSEAGSQLSTYNIGTANSGATWTSINGFTTSGTAAIDPAAHYADLALTLTTSGSVAGTALVDINSLLIQTSTGAAGAQSFILTQTFTSSGTFTVPTGVEYVTVVAIGAGQGGQGGGLVSTRGIIPASGTANGGLGGATGYWAIVPDIYVGNVGTAGVSVGIGAGGSGGASLTQTKPAGNNTAVSTLNGNNGSNGGNTTFGTFLTVPGARTAPTSYFGADSSAGASGGTKGDPTATVNGGSGATNAIGSTFVGAPYTVLVVGGSAGIAGTGGALNGAAGAASASAGIAGGGGGGGGARAVRGTAPTDLAGNGGNAAPCGGGGGGAVSLDGAFASTYTGTAGDGGAGGANTGGGGGGGGALAFVIGQTTSGSAITEYTGSVLTFTAGKGGDGGSGLLKVIYVG